MLEGRRSGITDRKKRIVVIVLLPDRMPSALPEPGVAPFRVRCRTNCMPARNRPGKWFGEHLYTSGTAEKLEPWIKSTRRTDGVAHGHTPWHRIPSFPIVGT